MGNDIGMKPADFTDNALADFGVTISWENSTKALHPTSGDETLSYAAAANKTAVFLLRSKTYEQSPEGLIEKGDAYVMVVPADGFAKDDKVTYGGVTYIIRKVINRETNEGAAFYDFCVLKIYD